MDLYFSPYACSMVVRIVADAAGVALALREVDLYTKRCTGDGADYLAVNPRGQVPVLVLDDGDHLVEVGAITQYLVARSPGSGLMGGSERERFRTLEGLSFAATEVHKRILFPLGALATPPAARAHARDSAPTVLADLARALGSRPFYAGDQFTVADAYLAWAFIIARTFRLELSPIEDYAARLAAVPSVARAIAAETPLALASWRRQRDGLGQAPWLR